MGLFDQTEKLPIWFMRQAGRYHSHYQNIRKNSDFMTMCKSPDLATEITMGPIDDFDFDAAILFSDLLFPLEALDMGLTYINGPPELAYRLETLVDSEQLIPVENPTLYLHFQRLAFQKKNTTLPETKSLLGFVGAPFTLYTYAVEGAHKGNLISSKKGLRDGRFERFYELLAPLVLEEMRVQARANPTAICLFDTAAGELDYFDYFEYAFNPMNQIIKSFKAEFPDTKIIYYSRGTNLNQLKKIDFTHIDVLGVDWRQPLTEFFKEIPTHVKIQGNLDPALLHLDWPSLEKKLKQLFSQFNGKLPKDRWVFGLGHGVLPKTPEENVRNVIKFVREQ